VVFSPFLLTSVLLQLYCCWRISPAAARSVCWYQYITVPLRSTVLLWSQSNVQKVTTFPAAATGSVCWYQCITVPLRSTVFLWSQSKVRKVTTFPAAATRSVCLYQCITVPLRSTVLSSIAFNKYPVVVFPAYQHYWPALMMLICSPIHIRCLISYCRLYCYSVSIVILNCSVHCYNVFVECIVASVYFRTYCQFTWSTDVPQWHIVEFLGASVYCDSVLSGGLLLCIHCNNVSSGK